MQIAISSALKSCTMKSYIMYVSRKYA